MGNHGVTYNLGSAKAFSSAIFETSFSNDKDIWIAATDYYMHFYIIVLLPWTTVFQLPYLSVQTPLPITRPPPSSQPLQSSYYNSQHLCDSGIPILKNATPSGHLYE